MTSVLPDMTHAELLDRLRTEAEQVGSIRALSIHYGLGPDGLGKILRGQRNLGAPFLRRLGLRRVTLIVHRYAPLKTHESPIQRIRKSVQRGEKIRLDQV